MLCREEPSILHSRVPWVTVLTRDWGYEIYNARVLISLSYQRHEEDFCRSTPTWRFGRSEIHVSFAPLWTVKMSSWIFCRSLWSKWMQMTLSLEQKICGLVSQFCPSCHEEAIECHGNLDELNLCHPEPRRRSCTNGATCAIPVLPVNFNWGMATSSHVSLQKLELIHDTKW